MGGCELFVVRNFEKMVPLFIRLRVLSDLPNTFDITPTKQITRDHVATDPGDCEGSRVRAKNP